MESHELFARVGALRKQEKSVEALNILREALRREQLSPDGVERAGRAIKSLLASSQAQSTKRILLLGQFTTSWLVTSLIAIGWKHGLALDIKEGAYDNVMQELIATDRAAATDLVVLLPWSKRLLDVGARPAAQRVDDECAFWRQTWRLLRERTKARIVQVGYDWVTPGALGLGLGASAGATALVRQTNDALRKEMPSGAFFLDLEQISGMMGRERFYDWRQFFWTKQPFSEAGLVRLSEHLVSAARALISGPKKVLVLDLDNTLWGGVVGETGPLGVELGEGPDGEAFRAFQQHCKELSARGVVLAVCSKNNPPDARGPFEQNPNMVLAIDDIAHFEASWDPKSVGLRRIAEGLQLGLDSFVFFDDNPAEREHIRQALPDVAVVEVPSDPADYIPALEAGFWFEAVNLTGEDLQRRDQYRAERLRRESEVTFDSLDEYLSSLQMVAEIARIDETNIERVVQLIGKTNQFNLTTRRHSLQTVQGMLRQDGSIGLAVRLEDRFGDHGLVAVVIAIPSEDPGWMEIDTWLMSCRVIGRTFEEFVFNALAEQARLTHRKLLGIYAPTAKNGLVKELYPRLGFVQRSQTTAGAIHYDLDLESLQPVKTFVVLKQPTAAHG